MSVIQEPNFRPTSKPFFVVLTFLAMLTMLPLTALSLHVLLLPWGGLSLPVVLALALVMWGAGGWASWVYGPQVTRVLLWCGALVFLPVQGALTCQLVLENSCTVDSCGDLDLPRVLHMPEGWGLFFLHGIAVVAFAISRRRPMAQRPWVEAGIVAALGGGVMLHLALGIQFVKVVFIGLMIPVLGFPALVPYVAGGLLAREAYSRLRRRGEEWRARPNELEVATYRDVEPRPRPERDPTRLRSLSVLSVLIGLQAIVQALWWKHPLGLVWTFSQTCAGPLSSLTRVVVQRDCHYLCTVAAQGHSWLVQPVRLGRRRGHVIIVNRQLAIANAFEDLLHERWPRLGRWARRTYDALAFPISRHIRSRWVADAIYVCMKPAEWLFYVALLLLDRQEPEVRIDRMYR